jgi:hypothetical protein
VRSCAPCSTRPGKKVALLIERENAKIFVPVELG